MKGSSRVIVGATLIMLVCLAIVLGLVLVLLAELYCSLLLRRRQLRHRPTSAPASTATTEATRVSSCLHHEHSETPSLSSFYAHGVLHAPRSFLFPSVDNVNGELDLEKQHYSQQPSSSSHQIGHSFSIPPSPTTFMPVASPGNSTGGEASGGSYEENYIYICNPIYDNDGNRTSRVDTPFETPDSSPSRLETTGSSSEEDDDEEEVSPSLTPMKELNPEEGCSVSLRDARSLAISGSDSYSNNYDVSSSSSSDSPCTTPSW